MKTVPKRYHGLGKVKASSEGVVSFPNMAKNGIRQLMRCVWGTHRKVV